MGLCVKKFLTEKTVKLNDSYQVMYKKNIESPMEEFYGCIGFSIPKMYDWKEEVHNYGNMSQKFLIPKIDNVQTLTLDLLEFIERNEARNNEQWLQIRKFVTTGVSHLTYSNMYSIVDDKYTGVYTNANNFNEITIIILDNNLTRPVYKYFFKNLVLAKVEPYEFSYDDEAACKWTLTFTFETMTKEAIAPSAKLITETKPAEEKPKTSSEQPKPEIPSAEKPSETKAELPATQQPAEAQQEAKEEKKEEIPYTADFTGFWNKHYQSNFGTVYGIKSDLSVEDTFKQVDPQLLSEMQKAIEKYETAHPGSKVVIERSGGVRTKKQQEEIFKKGYSQTLDSLHLEGFALDFTVYEAGEYSESKSGGFGWKSNDAYKKAQKQAAKRNAELYSYVEDKEFVEWGGDWKKFKDTPHFQINRKLLAEKRAEKKK